MRFLALGLLLVGCGSARAQISVESIKQVCVIKPAEKIETEGSLWVVPADAELTMMPAAIVRLSGLDGYQVTAKPIVLDPEQSPSVSGINRSTWLVSGASRVFLNVTAIDFDRGLFESEVITVQVSKPEPEPEPDTPDEPDQTDKPDQPEPDSIAPDKFDNIGRQANEWAMGLPGRRIIAGFYNAAAEWLDSDPTKTINQVSEQLYANITGSVDGDRYVEFRGKQKSDLRDRWPLNRFLLAEYFQAIAIGLGAGQ